MKIDSSTDTEPDTGARMSLSQLAVVLKISRQEVATIERRAMNKMRTALLIELRTNTALREAVQTLGRKRR